MNHELSARDVPDNIGIGKRSGGQPLSEGFGLLTRAFSLDAGACGPVTRSFSAGAHAPRTGAHAPRIRAINFRTRTRCASGLTGAACSAGIAPHGASGLTGAAS